MRPKGHGYKKAWVGEKTTLSRMSVDRKRKQSVHPAGKKKKKENVDCDPVLREVVEDTRAAVEDMMKELNDMVEQSTSPPKYIVTYDKAQDLIPPSSVDYMVCPCHDVRLEARESQKGWKYVKCPFQPCLLFCGQDQALEYMKAVYCQPHSEVLDMWNCLQCFCREPTTLQQSHSTQNPDRLYVTCSKKKCGFFRWADQPLGPITGLGFMTILPKKPIHSPNRQAVMLKGIPNVEWTYPAHHLL